jgi:hypothetical protein
MFLSGKSDQNNGAGVLLFADPKQGPDCFDQKISHTTPYLHEIALLSWGLLSTIEICIQKRKTNCESREKDKDCFQKKILKILNPDRSRT